jgi:hypothetical protein
MRWKVLATTLLVCGVLVRPAPAEALPITGAIGFAGAVEPISDFQTVTAIDIVNNMALVICDPISPCTGSFAGPLPASAEFNDFSFDPLPGPVSPQWSLNGFSFTLTNITGITRGPNGILLSGSGVLNGNNFDPTPASWSFSVDSTSLFRFSSTTTALPVSVPDGGSTLMLLGTGMLALVIARRKLGYN